MSDIKEISRRIFEEIWNQRRLEVAEELIATTHVNHDPQSPSLPAGVEGYKQLVRHYVTAFPDLHFTIDDQVCEGDTVAVRYTATGTHTGEFPGVPVTGRRISVTGMTVGKIKGGKLIESWGNWDTLGLLQQLGVLPAEAKGKAA